MKKHNLLRRISAWILALGMACMLLAPVTSVAEGAYLVIGSYGDDVYAVQSMLHQLGYYYPEPDGDYGYVTYDAVLRFQVDFGLYADGEAGPYTIDALYAYTGGPVYSSPSVSYEETSADYSGLSGFRGSLSVGSYGDDVSLVQSILYNLGYLSVAPDGYFGPVTEASVIWFQQDYGQWVDGVVGAYTMEALLAAGGNPGAIKSTVNTASAETASDIDYNAYLSIGSYGDMVVKVQQALANLGYYNSAIDGEYGYITAAAVEAYQIANGLWADGEAGPYTLQVLFGTPSSASSSSSTVSLDGTLRYGGTYVLTTAAGGNVLNVSGSSVYDGADVALNASSGAGSQKWVMQNAGNGYYYLRNLHSWKVLDLVNGNVQQSDATGAGSQMWKLVETDGGYQVVNSNGMYLDAASGSAKGSSASGSSSQVWKLQEVDPGTALDFTKDGTQYLGIRSFQISQGNVTETSGYYHIQTDIDLPSGDYAMSGGSNYSIGLKVMYVNSYLAQAGYLDWSYNGYNRYDGNTTWAVTRFQQDHGLVVDGVVGLQTWRAMGYTEYDYNHLGDYTTDLKVQAYGSSRETYVNAMISTAQEYAAAGTGFSDGASGTPGTYVDCSGLIFQCLYAAGINPSVNIIDHARVVYEYTSNNLGNDWRMGEAVSSAQEGDLIFYGGSSIDHVGIYAGNGMIYDSWPGVGVSARSIYSGGNILKIVRVF